MPFDGNDSAIRSPIKAESGISKPHHETEKTLHFQDDALWYDVAHFAKFQCTNLPFYWANSGVDPSLSIHKS